MSRLEKKCFIGSAGLHLLLLLILFVGPAFLSSRSRPDTMAVLDFVPMKTIDAAFAGGGNPNAKPPPPAPQPLPPQPQVAPPLPQPAPEPVAKPEPVKTVKASEPDPASLKPAPEAKTRRPAVNTKLVTRSRTTAKQSTSADEETQARATAKRRGEQLSSAVRSLREGLSSSTTVDMPGPGGGGPTYASYKQVLASIYYQAWHEPDEASADAATVVASVMVARDGTVLSARITKSSGDRAVDRSVQATLDRVKFIEPFPEGSKDEQRPFTVNFNAKAKRGLG